MREKLLNYLHMYREQQQRGHCRAPSPLLPHRIMDEPPREKRARADFFRAKEAKRAVKKQRKTAKLKAKLDQMAAAAADVATQSSPGRPA